MPKNDKATDLGELSGRIRREPEVMVLLSGGLDSAACVDVYLELGRPTCGLFVDYGQPSAVPEKLSARAIADHFSIPLMTATWDGSLSKPAGLITGRNAFLLMSALLERPATVSGIVIGIHAGTSYPDCTEEFVSAIQRVVTAYTNGAVDILAPFVAWHKADIYAYCRSRNLPIDLTYSCEAGGPPPCGNCLSCRDRRLLDVSP